MNAIQQVVPFFWVRDLARSVRFYVDGLGFSMTKRWIDGGALRWCWLEQGGAALMLQELSREPEGKVGVGVSLCFTCDDAIALYREFREREIDAQTPFVGNAMWVTGVVDPDGYQLFFESATDEAEETVYAASSS